MTGIRLLENPSRAEYSFTSGIMNAWKGAHMEAIMK